ncbi:MAG TPA: LysM peptidoglycan-binding domain-containing protein [Actinomycetota bacterium]|nr:LysM peptidoglycan-binding domain-containing protein [Actinomycetota bacterium]
MARTRVRWGRVAVLAVVLASTLWAAGRALGGPEAGLRPGRTHVVAQGETLWEIARELVGPEGDPRPVIEQLRVTNGLSSSAILEGQTLTLPAP